MRFSRRLGQENRDFEGVIIASAPKALCESRTHFVSHRDPLGMRESVRRRGRFGRVKKKASSHVISSFHAAEATAVQTD
jgi:hypothetical protein